jgi:RNA 2',3'-cyclic 3'-phosphodiesterase
MMVRIFICFDLPGEIREKLRALQSALKPLGRGVSWTRPEGIHLTLKFLGDVESGRIADIAAALSRATTGTRTFAISVQGVGAFPNLRRPRVLWVGIEEPGGALTQLARGIDEALGTLDFRREERPFSPHLTLGRVKSPDGIEAICQKLNALSFAPMTFSPSEVVVMRSDLRPDGAAYTPQERIELLK